MKNKKIIILTIIFIIIIIATVACVKLLKGNDIKKEDNIVELASTTVEERMFWSNFLKRNPYISQIDIGEDGIWDDTILINLAISSEDVETEYIVTEEIDENPTLSIGEGYKKSQKAINEYLKKTFNKTGIAYNFVETYVEDGSYLIINNNYVYFTKLSLPEKEYILVNFEQDENNFKAEIYEYDLNKENEERLTNMLNTGKIDKNIEISNKYIITGIMNNNDICILTKHKI